MFSAAVRSAVAALALITGAADANSIVVTVRSLPSPSDSVDPLAEAIAKGHAAGLKVYASFNVALAVPSAELPSAREHVIFRHPEWLMVPRTLAEDLVSVDPHSPEYLGRLARYARARPDTVEGLYLSPATPSAVAYMVGVVTSLVSQYAVDGVRLDAVRYPDGFDYDPGRLAALVAALGDAVKAIRPAAVVLSQ